jgi:hypothetical protein
VRRRREGLLPSPNREIEKERKKEKEEEKKERAGERESCNFRERETELEREKGCFRQQIAMVFPVNMQLKLR